MIARVFDEAERRDPDHAHSSVALVDGNNHQIDRLEAEAGARGIEVTVLVDFIHALEYLWKASWCFFAEGDPAAEDWVHDKAMEVLSGRPRIVAAAVRRKATTWGLAEPARKNADTRADYLLIKAAYLDYPTALSKGWPIATVVPPGRGTQVGTRVPIPRRRPAHSRLTSLQGSCTLMVSAVIRRIGSLS